MTLKSIQRIFKFLSLILIVAACAKDEGLVIRKKSFTISEDQLAPVYKANNVPADLQDSYIVVFKDDVAEEEIDGESERMCGNTSAKKERTFKHAVKGFSGRLTAAAIEEFRRNPKVKYIEQNQVVSLVATTQPGATWGLDRIDQANLPLSTNYTYNTTGSTITAYIFDTGVRSDHVEFGGRVTGGFSAIAAEPTPEDGNGHGTHVAGTVGGSTYGVAKAVKIIPVKVLSATGSGTNDGVIAGLDWAVANHTAGVPAVGNMSLGGGGSTALDDAVRRCVADGIVMAVAAGNDNRDVNNILFPTSPARVSEAITVGSTTSTDARSSFSNYGSVVDIFAPGSSITSASISSSTALIINSGTSMASPHVAGAAALYLEYAPGSTTAEVETGLKNAAARGRISGIPTGTTDALLQINFGTTPSLPVPRVPTLSSPANVATNVALAPTLSWAASTGAATYNLEYSTSSSFASGVVAASGITTTSRAISGLANSTVYYWRVSATNTIGTSAWSAVSSFTTVAPLAIPVAPTLSSPANLSTNIAIAPTLSWAAVTTAVSYNLEYSTSSTFASNVTSIPGINTTSRAISGLANNTTYYWRVSATNASGTSAWSAVRSFTTVAPLAIPVAPTLSSPANLATNVTRTPTMSWNAVTGAATYEIQISTTNTFSAVTFGRTGLTARSIRVSPQLGSRTAYFWRVRAVNTAGTGPWSDVRSFTTRQ
jgi:subtilisin family serine protease